MKKILNEQQLRKHIAGEVRKILREEDEKSDDVSKSATKLDVSKGPSAAIAFLNGPGADKRVRALLNAGNKDGIPEDEKAKVSETAKTLGDLQPTQIEIELTKSIAFPLSKFDSLKKMISGGVQRVGGKDNDRIVTSGNLIVDGHHRWSSLFSVAGPDAQIAAIDVALPEKDAASVLAIVQTAIASTLTGGEEVPKAKAGGMNILGKGKDELVKLITSAWKSGGGESGAILTDEFVKQCIDDPQVSKHFGINTTAPGGTPKKEPEGEQQKSESRDRFGSLLEKSSKLGKGMDKRIAVARRTIINKVADNLSQMAAPAEGSPPRVDMPQLDQATGGVQGALSNLQKGRVNYKTPFKIVDKGKEREINVPAESTSPKGDLVLERWQKLAGLIK